MKTAIDDLINPLLLDAAVDVRLEAFLWEDVAAHLTESPRFNDEFVAKARGSHLVIVLVYDELRAGTREELLAVLAEGVVDVAVIQFGQMADATRSLLQGYSNLVWKEVADPRSPRAYFEVLRPVLRAMIQLLRQDSVEGGDVLNDRYTAE